MYPVLFTVGPIAITSVGFFLIIGVVLAIFTIWKVAKTYEVNQDRVLDIAIMTIIGSLLGARLHYIALHPDLFDSIEKYFSLVKISGLSFWGAFLGGMLTLWFFTVRSKINFWQAADLASLGSIVALIFGDIGCFLGGCQVGIPFNSFLAFPVTGLIGKRLAVTLIEAAVLVPLFFNFKDKIYRFHFPGQITAWFLVSLGLVKFVTEFFRADSWLIPSMGWVGSGHVLALTIFGLGLAVYYTQSKKNLVQDLLFLVQVFYQPKKRKIVLSTLRKTWYNQQILWNIRLKNLFKSIKVLNKSWRKILHVKQYPTSV